MKTKLLAFLILCVTLFGLVCYYSEYFGVSKEGLYEENRENSKGQKEVQKKVFLEKKEVPNLRKVEKKLSRKEKVQKIREKSKHFKIIEIAEEKFYFDIVGKNLVLKHAQNNFEIGSFVPVLEKDIKIFKIYGNPQKFLLSLGDKKYIFSKTSGVSKSFDFKLAIDYIKEDELYFIIKSEKGIFLLDKKTGNINYAHIFSDFVLHGSNYLAIMQADDKKRLEKYTLDQNKKDKILFYNPVSKEQRVILESDVSLERIYKIGKQVFVENKTEEIFELKNF